MAEVKSRRSDGGSQMAEGGNPTVVGESQLAECGSPTVESESQMAKGVNYSEAKKLTVINGATF